MHKIENGTLYDDDGGRVCDVDAVSPLPHSAWRQWSRNPKNRSFRFTSKQTGLEFLLVKEERTGGSGRRFNYWYCHHEVNGEKRHLSAGPDRKITIKSLELVARKLARIRLANAADPESRPSWIAQTRAIHTPRRDPKPEPIREPQRAPVQRGLFDD